MSGPLSRRGVTLLLNPYDPIESRIGYGNGIIGFGPGQGNNIQSAVKWEFFGNKLPMFSWWKDNDESTGITDGAYFPTSNKAVKHKGSGQTYFAYYLQITETSKNCVNSPSSAFSPNYDFWPFPFSLGGNSKNYLGSHLKYTFSTGGENWVNAPFDAGTEYCANTSASALENEGKDDKFSYWRKTTQQTTGAGEVTLSQELLELPKEYDPLNYGWKKWITGTWSDGMLYWKEDGQPITSNDLVNTEPFNITYNPRYILARDTDYTPYQIYSTDYTVQPKYGLFSRGVEALTSPYIAFQSPAVNYTYLRDLKTMKIEIFAARKGIPCTPCSYAGKKVNFVIKYQEGDVTIQQTGIHTKEGNYLEYNFTWGEVQETRKQGTLSGDEDDWYSDYPEQDLDSQSLSVIDWGEGELPKGKARRLVDFYVESIE